MDRTQIAANLEKGLDRMNDEELVRDHKKLIGMILGNESAEKILNSAECDRWPETYAWLKSELEVGHGRLGRE